MRGSKFNVHLFCLTFAFCFSLAIELIVLLILLRSSTSTARGVWLSSTRPQDLERYLLGAPTLLIKSSKKRTKWGEVWVIPGGGGEVLIYTQHKSLTSRLDIFLTSASSSCLNSSTVVGFMASMPVGSGLGSGLGISVYNTS